jgi:hypothetical protein
MNCKYIFKFHDYESEEYYCNHDKSFNPEFANRSLSDGIIDKSKYKTWAKWSQLHDVSPGGICDEYEREEVEE